VKGGKSEKGRREIACWSIILWLLLYVLSVNSLVYLNGEIDVLDELQGTKVGYEP
jgi:hypothetical protein